MIVHWYVGFHRPWLRNPEGWFDPRGIFGHCEAWGYTDEGTWLFLDPQGSGTKVRVTHLFDEVEAQLTARFALCDMIVKLPAADPVFRLPVHGPMTCASVCGALIGVRAYFPATLRRRLLRKGAEVIHEAEGRSGR